MCQQAPSQRVHAAGGVSAAGCQERPQAQAKSGGGGTRAILRPRSLAPVTPKRAVSTSRASFSRSSWGNARVPSHGARRASESVVMFKNEELIQTGVSALEYLKLVKGTGGSMGGTICTWLRVGRSGVFALPLSSEAIAQEMFKRTTGAEVETMSIAQKQDLKASLGLLSYACDPEGMHSLLHENCKLALAEMGVRAGGEEGLSYLVDGGLLALAIVSWGAAPVQSGGRSAERKYLDIIVHLSPADDVWTSGEVHLEIVTPAKKGSLTERGGGGGMLARAKQAQKSAAGASGKEYADWFPVDAAGMVAPGDMGTMVVRQGKTLIAPPASARDVAYQSALAFAEKECGLTLEQRQLLVADLHLWDEVLVLGAPMLCCGVKSVDTRAGETWLRKGPESPLAFRIREHMQRLVLDPQS